jgi:hypothetical protein
MPTIASTSFSPNSTTTSLTTLPEDDPAIPHKQSQEIGNVLRFLEPGTLTTETEGGDPP